MRSLQAKVAVAFAAVILGFLGAVLFVPLALWPSVQRAEAIQRDYGEAVRALAELRGA